MSKVLFIDIDGTLVTYSNVLLESTKLAIQKVRDNGHLVYLCTGRSEAEIQQDILDMGFDGLIGGNGSYVKQGQKVLLHQHLTYQDCKKVVDWCREREIEFFLECNSGLYASENFDPKALPAILEYLDLDQEKANNMSVSKAFPDLQFGLKGDQLIREDVNKISFLLNSMDDLEAAKQDLSIYTIGSWGGKNGTTLFGDVTTKNISKKNAIQLVLDSLGKTVEDAIAFGDAKVDVPMFEVCKTSVAMGNAPKDIQEQATLVTEDVENDGLASALKRLELME